jgi:hypothetical protein
LDDDDKNDDEIDEADEDPISPKERGTYILIIDT